MVWLICNWTESRTVEQPLVSRDLYPRNCYLPCLQGLLRSNTYTVYILNRSYLPYSPILSINRLFLKRHTLLLSASRQISFKSPRKPRKRGGSSRPSGSHILKLDATRQKINAARPIFLASSRILVRSLLAAEGPSS